MAIGSTLYNPMSGGFTTLNGNRVGFQGANAFTLGEVISGPIGPALRAIGGSGARYLNAPLANRGVLHASALRLRWYGSGSHAENIPPC